jgi:tetratricopeptide (TPR) repeat protein
MRCNTSLMNSWHSFSPNSRWLVFSSKANTPYTEMFLTHIDEQGNDSPPILIPHSTAANRAVNIPEFVNIPYEALADIRVPAVQHLMYALRGREFLEKKNLDEALGQFDKAVESQPDYVDGHVTAGVILIEKGLLAEADEHLQKAIQLDPKCWYAHANLGVLAQRQGRLDEAIAHLETTVKLKPDHFEAQANLGKCLLEKGLPDRAQEHFRAAAKVAPEDAASHASLGSYLAEKKMFAEAAAQWEVCLASHPRFVDARLMLGRALAAQGKFAEALGHFGTACEMEPRNLQAVNDLAWLLATCPQDATRNGGQAVQLAAAACKLSSYQDPVLLNTLAAAYAEVGQWPEAVATASQALELAKPRDADLAQEISQHLERYRRREAVR